MKLETTNKKKYPCEWCADGIYMSVEDMWWCDKHLKYACQMERNRGLCEKFEPTSGDDAVSRKAVLDMATVIETDDYSGNEIMEVVDTEDIKALPSVKPASKPEQSCEDVVSRAEAKELAWGLCLETCYDNEKVIEMLDDLPSVTPAPKKLKRAHWIDNHNGAISCGCCYAWFHKDDRYSYMRYCPNCGAKLEVEE